MSFKDVFYAVFAVVVAGFVLSACDNSNIPETPEEALAWVKTAGEAIAEQPARGVVTLDGKTISSNTQVTDEGSEVSWKTTDISRSFEFEADGKGGISIKTEETGDLSVYGLDDIKIPASSETQLEHRYAGGQGYMGFSSDLISQSDLRSSGDTTWVTTDGFIGLCPPLLILDFRGLISDTCDPQTEVHKFTQQADPDSVSIGETETVNGVEATRVSFRVVDFQTIEENESVTPDDSEPDESVTPDDSETPDESVTPDDSDILEVELWIDGDGLIRRAVVDETSVLLSFLESFGGSFGVSSIPEDKRSEAKLITTIDFNDFDNDIYPIEAPPSELIVGESSIFNS